MVAVAAVAVLVTTKTPFGRRVYAVGGNDRAAVLAGIRVSRITIAVYVISGACAALAGMLLTSELGAAYPDTATTYELNAIAAAVLGGTALSGGRGTIVGTVMGAFVIGFLADGHGAGPTAAPVDPHRAGRRNRHAMNRRDLQSGGIHAHR
jgi:erythritol transport system permease protein